MAYERKFNRTAQTKPTGNSGGNVKYDTMAKEVVEWNPNNFLEISKKSYKAQDGSGEKNSPLPSCALYDFFEISIKLLGFHSTISFAIVSYLSLIHI